MFRINFWSLIHHKSNIGVGKIKAHMGWAKDGCN